MFEVTEKDLVGELVGFPIEVVRMMIVRQLEQGNAPNVLKFQREPRAAVYGGGFDWERAVEGFDFWSAVIGEHKWHVFFDKYPCAIEMPNIKKTKPLKAQRKMHFTKAQKWCLERIRLNTGTIHNRLKTILNEDLPSTPNFDFPILPSEIEEALKLFCIEEYDSASLDAKCSALRMRISETLTSIYYMNQAFMRDEAHGTVRIYDKKLKGVRSAMNWAKKHYCLLDKIGYVRFLSGNSYNTSIDVIGDISGLPSIYEYDKTTGAYRSNGSPDRYILGNILLIIH